MKPATVSKQHVPPCDQMTKEQQAVVEREQQAVVDRYHQGVKSKLVQKGLELVYIAKQQRALELVVEERCPIAQRDGYYTVR